MENNTLISTNKNKLFPILTTVNLRLPHPVYKMETQPGKASAIKNKGYNFAFGQQGKPRICSGGHCWSGRRSNVDGEKCIKI